MLYEPVRKNRLFAVGTSYADIDASSLAKVLQAFEKRIGQWYIEPIRLLENQPGQHGAFAAMALCCLLIDCLCQFEKGKVVSNRSLFISFIRRRLPHYNTVISPAICFPKVDNHACTYKFNARGQVQTQQIANVSDAIYYIYRCGILHSAHAPLCGVISGLNVRRFSIRPNSLTTYKSIGMSGSPCPTIVIDPWKLFADVENEFQNYLYRITTSGPSTSLRRRFNLKFADAFGIDVSGAA